LTGGVMWYWGGGGVGGLISEAMEEAGK
jgi:hypothetical protein